VFFSTLAFAFLDRISFIGLPDLDRAFGLYQAVFMAKAGAPGTTPRRSSRPAEGNR